MDKFYQIGWTKEAFLAKYGYGESLVLYYTI